LPLYIFFRIRIEATKYSSKVIRQIRIENKNRGLRRLAPNHVAFACKVIRRKVASILNNFRLITT
jgi:hypothetical protein